MTNVYISFVYIYGQRKCFYLCARIFDSPLPGLNWNHIVLIVPPTRREASNFIYMYVCRETGACAAYVNPPSWPHSRVRDHHWLDAQHSEVLRTRRSWGVVASRL